MNAAFNPYDVWLLIPAFNAAPTLSSLLSKTCEYIPIARTIVVDDGSRDGTIDIIHRAGAAAVSHIRNIGKGAALRTGFNYILGQNGKWILTMDADGQHPPESIPLFLSAAQTDNYDLIIGARWRNGKMPLDRRFSNWSTSKTLGVLTGEQILDSQCGFRLLRTSMIGDIRFITSKFDFETEYLLKLIRKGARIGWVEIPTLYAGESTSIRRLVDTMRFLRLLSMHLTGRLYREAADV
ncbi:MAG: glycosyltransferase family 2 protein [Calditrichaeota bacterium]|nr:glycosyltransferase family 2 protein [Calditrichota bacterium]